MKRVDPHVSHILGWMALSGIALGATQQWKAIAPRLATDQPPFAANQLAGKKKLYTALLQ